MDQNYFLKKKKKRYQNFKSWVYTWTCMFFFVLFFFCPPHCEWLTILIQEYWISMYSSFSVCIKEKGENLILVCYLMVKSRPINCMLYVSMIAWSNACFHFCILCNVQIFERYMYLVFCLRYLAWSGTLSFALAIIAMVFCVTTHKLL